jgi:hypothetical protein
MNLRTHIHTPARAVALVITLLMLSVITFLAIAFLAMTNRNKAAMTTTLDVDTARAMSDAALARAQTEIIAQMMAATDVLSYDYMASHNYINPFGFRNNTTGAAFTNATNVNYDWAGPLTNTALSAWNWAQNIANLFYDPRPPVFVMTNGNLAAPQNDFRYWVDLNRNGRFESNGYVRVLGVNGLPISPSGGYAIAPPYVSNLVNGEPEWIGVLKYPEYVHSPTNPFVGRYAYMALPIGKTLDLNYIHNYAKYLYNGIRIGTNYQTTPDDFVRDQGVGSWELNLAAFLYNLSPYMYQSNLPLPFNSYNYNYSYPTPNELYSPNSGGAFNDAVQFLSFRYGGIATNIQTLYQFFGAPFAGNLGWTALDLTNNDLFGIGPSSTYPFDYFDSAGANLRNDPWPGGYNSNMFYDMQDLFDPNKTGLPGATVEFSTPPGTGLNFASNLVSVGKYIDSTNRYTFQRLLDSIGTGSAPEYGVYVYSNNPPNTVTPSFYLVTNVSTPGALPPPSWLRTKVNINYDNTAQIQAGPYAQTPAGPYGPFTPMPTNLVHWTPLGFFTNAADLLLRSQVIVYTNYVTNNPVIYPTYPLNAYVPSNYIVQTFGITNIPIYNATNPGITYNEQVHRMLQLAANIYAAANPAWTNGAIGPNGSSVPFPLPPVFRPQFQVISGGSPLSNLFVYITNFALVTNDAYFRLSQPFFDLPSPPTNNNVLLADGLFNYWGVPWVIGAVTNIPQFDQYSYQNLISQQRQLFFVRYTATPGPYDVHRPPQYTNQFYTWAITSDVAMDAWNPYSNTFVGSQTIGTSVVMSNFVTITLTNNATNFPYNWGTNIYTNNSLNYNYNTYSPPALTNPIPFWRPRQFMTFFSNNFTALPNGYVSEFSQSTPRYIPFASIYPSNYLAADTVQTTYPRHYWSVNTTNHLFYALFDGNNPGQSGGAHLLDFVNLGPFGSSFPFTQYLIASNQFNISSPYYPGHQLWTIGNASDAGNAQLPIGASNQIYVALMDIGNFYTGQNTLTLDSLQGRYPGGYGPSKASFGLYAPSVTLNTPAPPYANYTDSNSWMACDPLVHYTIGDLTSPNPPSHFNWNIYYGAITNPLTVGTGEINARYAIGIGQPDVHYADPGLGSPDKWQFPTNLFPSVGWLGRVHRGTPWQTVYLKSDDPSPAQSYGNWYSNWVNSPFTYPTNDWSLIDLFTAVPNDNAARGLLSVNQTNDAAWAAVFGGVIVMTNLVGGLPLNPTGDVSYLMDSNVGLIAGINAVRSNQPNGIFHKIGDILQASALTVQSSNVLNFIASGGTPNDEMMERIPQQTLGLLKLGLPQFVIYSWGQSLKPKNLYSTGSGNLQNICTNYEITGEYLTRTVCHIVSDPSAAAPRIVIDNFNIEPGN